jgi:hypothetical protein
VIDGSNLLIGLPDGFPEPCFIEVGRVRAIGISVKWSEYEAEVTYIDQNWKIGVTDYYKKVNNPEYRAEFLKKSREAHEMRRKLHPE